MKQEKALQALHSENERLGLYKDAYAQPEQEPVAYLCENAVGHKYFRWKKPSSTYKPIALYTTPPQRKEPPDWFHAVENILNEYGLQAIDFVADFKAAMKDAEHSQRTWVGLAAEDRLTAKYMQDAPDGIEAVTDYIEAKLKQKNGFSEEKNT